MSKIGKEIHHLIFWTDEKKELYSTLVLVFLSILVVMFVFEMTKQVLIPDITIWQSHIITIIFTSVMAIIIIYIPLRSSYREQQNAKDALRLQHESEEKMRESYAILKGVFDSPKEVVIFALDRQFRYISFNDKHRQMMKQVNGVDISLGDNMVEYVGDPNDRKKFMSNFDRVLAGESFTVVEQYGDIVLNNRWFGGTYNPIKNEHGNIFGLTLILMDITDTKHAEEAIRLANKKLNLLSGITRHDIRNQLMMLASYIVLSEKSQDDKVKIKKYITEEKRIVDIITGQINFTKDYENLGVNAPSWQNVRYIIKKVITHLAMRNIAITVSEPEFEIFADPLLEKVFFNLIDNALRYGGEQMSIIQVSNHEHNGVMIIVIEDDGVGVSANDKPQLFNRGFGKNTGLGLYLCREILSITNITISENGEPGKGARFEMTVPIGAYRLLNKQ